MIEMICKGYCIRCKKQVEFQVDREGVNNYKGYCKCGESVYCRKDKPHPLEEEFKELKLRW